MIYSDRIQQMAIRGVCKSDNLFRIGNIDPLQEAEPANDKKIYKRII
jgi:hypothetical protein